MGQIWNWLVNRATADVRVIRDSPLAFGICLFVLTAITGVSIWIMLDFKYSSQIVNANSFNAYLTRQLDDSQKYMQIGKTASPIGGFGEKSSRQAGQKNPFELAAGCQYIGGQPFKITVFHNYSRSELVAVVNETAFALERLEIERGQSLLEAASVQGESNTEDAIEARSKAILLQEEEFRKKFQKRLTVYVRPMWDELHTRLKHRYPTSEEDGVSTDAMLAYCTGIVTGEHPLASLASYMRALSARLPS